MPERAAILTRSKIVTRNPRGTKIKKLDIVKAFINKTPAKIFFFLNLKGHASK